MFQPSRIEPLLALVAAPLHRFCLPLLMRMQVEGLHHLPTVGPVILAPNHTSRWDALVVRFFTGRDTRFIASCNEFHGLQGWLMARLGAFAVDPERPGSEAWRHSLELLGRGLVLVVFPEGGIFAEGSIQPLKPGVGRLAVQVPGTRVVPMAIRYAPGPLARARVQVRLGQSLAAADFLESSRSRREAATALNRELFERLLALLPDSLPNSREE